MRNVRCGCAILAAALPIVSTGSAPCLADEQGPAPSLAAEAGVSPRARAAQVSAGVGAFFPTEVWAHLNTHTDTAISYHADVSIPGPWLDYGLYLRQVTLRSSESGGTAALFTAGLLAKYELRPGRRHFVRAGVLLGCHDLWSDTIDHALGLDLGASLEWAVQIAGRARLRVEVQGTSMLLGGFPHRLSVGFGPTLITVLGVEYAFGH